MRTKYQKSIQTFNEINSFMVLFKKYKIDIVRYWLTSFIWSFVLRYSSLCLWVCFGQAVVASSSVEMADKITNYKTVNLVVIMFNFFKSKLFFLLVSPVSFFYKLM